MRLEDGDKLGFTDETASGPIAFTSAQTGAGSGAGVLKLASSGNTAGVPPRVGEVYTAGGQKYRRRYSINVDVGSYRFPGNFQISPLPNSIQKVAVESFVSFFMKGLSK